MPQPIKTAARAAESRFRKKTEDTKVETAGMMRWLLTYADMITLMLALFIILFALSTINRVKFQQFAKDVSGGFDNVWAVNQPPQGGQDAQKRFNAPSSIPAIQKQLEAYVQNHKLQSQVQIRMDHRGLVVTLLSDKSYYDTGSAKLRPQTKKILDAVDSFLRKNDNLIRVEGNTDNVPIATAEYPSNWELSTARAVNVVRYLVEHDRLAPDRIAAAGYGQYRPRTDNSTPAARLANR